MITTIRQTLDLIGRERRGRWVALVVLAIVASGFEMAGAALVYLLLALVADPDGGIDLPVLGDVTSAFDGGDRQAMLLWVVLGMGLFFLFRAVVQVGVTYVQQRVAQNAGARLSNQLVEGYLGWPYEMHLHRNSSELIRNGHQAVKQLVSQVFSPLIRVGAEFVLVLGMLILLVAVAPAAAGLAALVIGGAAVVLLVVVQPRLKRLGAVSHETSRETLSWLQQSLQGVRDIKLLGRERWFARRYADGRLRYARANYLYSALTELPNTIMQFALVCFILVFFAISITSGATGQGALSVLGLFAYAGLRLQPSLQRIITGLNNIKYSTAPLADLHADLERVRAHSGPVSTAEALPFEDRIEVRELRFRYEGADRDALSGVDLVIRRGEEIGICGSTGGGKTTFVDLLTGLLAPTAGSVLVDGQDLREHARAWQRNLGVVPQTVFLIDDTIRHNIALGVPDRRIDDDRVSEAIELAQVREFIDSLPDGLDTRVGERGVRLSGGQRQRIAIARALYRRPSVLVFDEGTSALDNETEAALMSAIEGLRGDRTIIHIAHRLTTVRMCDRVVLIDDGRISAVGSFDDLRETNSHFRRMAAAT